jgi:signal transduction histidine kinase
MTTTKRTSWLIILIYGWLLFVVSLSVWWLIFTIRTIRLLAEFVKSPDIMKKHDMIIMEGSVLIVFLLVGGAALIYFALREKKRFEEVKHFFSTFSHDLKTSISRLILQSETLFSSEAGKNLEKTKKFQKNLLTLEMQLENSLFYAQQGTRQMALEPMEIKTVISRLHTQWPDLKIHLQGQGKFLGDQAAIESIFKNLVSNASLHGGADEIQLKVENQGKTVNIRFSDNGQLAEVDISKLGQQLHPSQNGTGIGLFLVRQWVERMKGEISFSKSDQGNLEVTLLFPGAS